MPPWHFLPPLSNSSTDLPPLFLNHSSTDSSYTVSLCDLTHIWTESLDRKQILRRASDDDSEIDPSDSPSQLKILLGLIIDALNGKDGTQRHLERRGASQPDLKYGSDVLGLTLSAPLPPPLGALNWTLNLKLQDGADLTDRIILPLLTAAAAQKEQLDELSGTIKDKDHVIDKLIDKLTEVGVDLGMVFPGIAGLPGMKKDGAREVAGERIIGLKTFDRAAWNGQLAQDSAAGMGFGDAVQKVFDAEGTVSWAEGGMSYWGEDGAAKWLDNLVDEKHEARIQEYQNTKPAKPSTVAAIKKKRRVTESSEEDSDFQVRCHKLFECNRGADKDRHR
jgi:XLF-Cernunnos, XRcc4-like factor, NHEJ component